MQVYQSHYVTHSYDSDNKTLFTNWLNNTEAMSKDDFKYEMEKWLEVTQQHSVNFIYDYCVDFLYTINPEEQVWMANLLNSGWIAAGVQKYAHIVPEEFITNISVEQLFEEFHRMKLKNQFIIKHFPEENADIAKHWLLKENKAVA